MNAPLLEGVERGTIMRHAALASLLSLSALTLACDEGGGLRPPLPPRTVSGRFETVHRADDGTTTVVPGPPPGGPVLSALLVQDESPAGWATFPVTVAADGSFEVADVPGGTYWLRLDDPAREFSQLRGAPQGGAYAVAVPGTSTELVPAVADAPDLSTVVAVRPDVARATLSTPVTLNVSNLVPWDDSSWVLVVSSRADVFARLSGGVPAPGAGTRTFAFDWTRAFGDALKDPGLPDAALGDVLLCYQHSAETLVAGSATADVLRATRRARLDSVTLADGVAASIDVPLTDPPETGTVPTSMLGSLFAALAPDVSASAVPVGPVIAVWGRPHALAYPDMPRAMAAPLAQLLATTAEDVDFGPLSYGHVLDPHWEEYVTYAYSFGVSEYGDLSTWDAQISARVPVSAATGHVVPVLGPPRELAINGDDAHASRTGVGLQPVLSWSEPSIGTPSSYMVTIRSAQGLQPGGIGELRATVFGATSFRIPPGFLSPGVVYRATVTARRADWEAPSRAPFRTGFPLYMADAVSGMFEP